MRKTMGQRSDLNLDADRRYQAVERVCAEFQLARKNNSQFCIEDILPNVPDLIAPIISLNHGSIFQEILSELILLEMDILFAENEEICPLDYYRRFPDYGIAIDASLERLRKLDENKRLNSRLVATALALRDTAGSSGGWSIKAEPKSTLPVELGPFREIAEISSGGFGVVCRAVDSRNGQQVALKFPREKYLENDEMLNQFLEEAHRAQVLDHPGIVKTIAVEQIDGYLTIVQQLIEGSDLKKSLDQFQSATEIAELVAKIADALAYANRQGIVHRDLKPANILLDRKGRPFIADFGLAIHETGQLEMPRQRCGTPPYMSPQLVAGLTRNLDGRSDIWSLGVILYELLVGRRPFRGSTAEVIFEQIETRDPKPLRQIDHTIDKELERICLKCLARPTRERYLTADDLAEDLRFWIEKSGKTTLVKTEESGSTFVPKGLRAFGAEDSNFFLDLLPGPTDRDGVPASIRFWRVRINEPVAEENRVPVGVIYGPSGSGKSSFVKAGLMPQVKDQVHAVYVESTQSDTEVRIIKALRERFPTIPLDLGLPEIFAGLAASRWQKMPRKIVIFLDQFEQRLSAADDYEQSQLARALRHCDGQNLQSMLLVRDDFWLALTRFSDALEMDLLEGQNSQDIDLFDRPHAKKVLLKLGRAYGRLPEGDLTDEQDKFLNEVVEQLAVGNHVICVRLTLFAEMFKSRDWSLAELRKVGGIHGVGEKFLEETFGTPSGSRRFQWQRESVQNVLEALLPDSGSDIRGAMKSETELMLVARAETSPGVFQNLIKILDQELKLITRTDPDEAGGAVESATSKNIDGLNYFQLTHDYLIPSVRIWLERTKSETAKGRIHTRLSNLSRLWNRDQDDRFLPTLIEFLQARFHLSKNDLSVSEHSFWIHAQTYYLIRGAWGVFTVVLMASLVGIFVQRHEKELAREYVDRFMKGHPEAALSNLLLMEQYEKYSQRLLLEKRDSTNDPEQNLRANLGLALLGNRANLVLDNLVQAIDPKYDSHARNIIEALRVFPSSQSRITQRYESLSDGMPNANECKSRLAIALCFLGNASWVADRISNESTDVQTLFIHAFCTFHGDLEQLGEILNEDSSEKANALLCLAIGKLRHNSQLSLSCEKVVVSKVNEWYSNCSSSYLVSSADWALRQFGTQPLANKNEPMVNSSGQTSSNFFRIDSLAMRMHRIAPRRVNLRANIRGNYHEMDYDVSNVFFAAEREITVRDFNQFLMDSDYSFDKPVGLTLPENQDQPATHVSFIDSIMFCNWLSRKEGLAPCYRKLETLYAISEEYEKDQFREEIKVPLNEWELIKNSNGFRLPSYSEWQCLEKTQETDFCYFGSTAMKDFAHGYGWLGSNCLDAFGRSAPQDTRQKMPNQFGLFDIYGNASEFCWNFPFRSKDPLARQVGFYPVARGNNCSIQPAQLNPIEYDIYLPWTRSRYTSFRVVLNDKK